MNIISVNSRTMTGLRIKLHCKCCGKVHELPATHEDEEQGRTNMACNYCMECDANGLMQDYYNEWPIDESELPVIENPNQLELEI